MGQFPFSSLTVTKQKPVIRRVLCLVEHLGQHSKNVTKQRWSELWMLLSVPPAPLQRVLTLLPAVNRRLLVRTETSLAVKRQVRLNEADISKLADDYRSGATVMELALRYGIHRTTVMRHLRQKGIPKQASKLTREQVAQAKYLRRLGMSYLKIGRLFTVDEGTICYAIA